MNAQARFRQVEWRIPIVSIGQLRQDRFRGCGAAPLHDSMGASCQEKRERSAARPSTLMEVKMASGEPVPMFGDPIGPWHWHFTWRPVRSYDQRLIWPRWVEGHCIQKHSDLKRRR